jgi:hypothetical protein
MKIAFVGMLRVDLLMKCNELLHQCNRAPSGQSVRMPNLTGMRLA